MGLEDRVDALMGSRGSRGSPSAKRNSPSVGGRRPSLQSSDRRGMLRDVFLLFDLDDSGVVESEELLELGRGRRELGHKKGPWTEEMNNRLMRKLDTDESGTVSCSEFLNHFEASLPADMLEFQAVVAQFMEVARKTKLALLFSLFDLDGSGTVEANELLALGKARRELGQRSGGWSEEQNNRLVQKMNTSGSGKISLQEFVKYLSGSLPPGAPEMKELLTQFLSVARTVKLQQLFARFDLDGSGAVEVKELLALGKARRELGQKQGEWTEEMNDRMFKKLDTNGDGLVDASEFVSHFNDVLPGDTAAFKQILAEFSEVASSLGRQRAPASRRSPPGRATPASPGKSPSRVSAEARHRQNQLRQLFGLLDLNGTGVVTSAELLSLGKQQGARGQQRAWTEEQNTRLVREMDANGDGKVSCQQFMSSFEGALPADENRFDASCRVLTELARSAKLRQVFELFDLDRAGEVASKELLVLRKAGRELGQKQGEWTEEMNDRMFKKLDRNPRVTCEDFVSHFNSSLPASHAGFKDAVSQYIVVAAASSRGQSRSRSPAHTPPPQQPSSSPPVNSPAATKQWRERRLAQVYQELDLDHNGHITQGEVARLKAALQHTGSPRDSKLAVLPPRAVITCSVFVQHMGGVMAEHSIEEFEQDLSQLLDAARGARIQRATGRDVGPSAGFEHEGIAQVRTVLEGIMKDLDAKKERRRQRQLEDAQRQVGNSVEWSSDIIRDFDEQIRAFGVGSRSPTVAEELLALQPGEHVMDAVEELAASRLSPTKADIRKEGSTAHELAMDQVQSSTVLRADSKALAVELQTQLHTLQNRSAQAEQRLNQAKRAQADTQDELEAALQQISGF